MTDVRVQWKLPDGRYKQILARQAVWTNDTWRFIDVVTWNHMGAIPFPEENEFLAMTHFTETPEEIKSEIKVNDLTGIQAAKRPQLSLKEILDYRRVNPEMTPEKLALLKTQFYGRIAEPWTCLVVALIAIPFGSASGRRNLFAGVASGIFIAFSFFILQRFGLALGTSGALWPWLAAWLPNLAFGGIGIWLTGKLQ
jgi:lipopolysaccharide export LptBFGC system permease protein LptF